MTISRIRQQLFVGIAAVLLLAGPIAADAALRIKITEGQDRGIPIAVVPFGVEGTTGVNQDLGQIIEDDLRNSGRFDPVPRTDHLSSPTTPEGIKFKDFRLLKTDAMVIGKVVQNGPDSYRVEYRLFDVFKGAQGQLDGQAWPQVSTSELRVVAHRIADRVYEKLTGVRGAFDTDIAYVAVNGQPGNRTYSLKVSDYDGFAPQEVFISTNREILSPAWSPDKQHLAFLNGAAFGWELSVQHLASSQREVLMSTTAYVGAPAWSPDGSRIAFSTSDRDGNAEIYVINVASKAMQRMTDNRSIDTQPAWSVDGSSIYFMSDRSGNPQIYEVNASGGQARRLTFDGKKNERPAVAPDGKSIAVITNQGSGYQTAIYNLQTRQTRILSETRNDESPTYAPNGAMVIYATKTRGKSSLRGVSADGRFRYTLPSDESEVRSPAWSPFEKDSGGL